MATILGEATLNISVSTVGTLYVSIDYVAVNYVEGTQAGITAIVIGTDPFNTFTLNKETRLNTVTAETRLFPVLQETRSFKIKRPAFVGTRRRDTINV